MYPKSLPQSSLRCDAIRLALEAFPDKSQRTIAAQIGCSKSRVGQIREQVANTCHLPTKTTGRDGKQYPATRKTTVRESRSETARVSP